MWMTRVHGVTKRITFALTPAPNLPDGTLVRVSAPISGTAGLTPSPAYPLVFLLRSGHGWSTRNDHRLARKRWLYQDP